MYAAYCNSLHPLVIKFMALVLGLFNASYRFICMYICVLMYMCIYIDLYESGEWRVESESERERVI